MTSLSFPKMFGNGYHTLTVDGKKASVQNVRLSLLSPKDSLFGDPEFGSLLKARLFSQNGIIIKDLVIDDVYTTIKAFVPQVMLKRSDIQVDTDGTDVFVKIKCKNDSDYELDTFVINLTT